MRRLACALLVLLVAPAVAGAHGGRPILEERDGGYAITVLAAPVTQDGAPALDLTTYLTRQDLGEPDLAADVTLRITDEDETRTLRPAVLGDGYEVVVPGAADAWRDWTVEAVVAGPAGRATVRAVPGSGYGGLSAGLVIALLAAVALAAAGSVLVLRRRLRAADAPLTAQESR